MTQRLNPHKHVPELVNKLVELGTLAKSGTIEPAIHHLVEIRASQLNGCALCVDMHVKQARMHDERELRLHHLVVWRESQLFSARERAALEWTEALTQLGPHGVSDEVFARVREQFSEAELSALTFAVMTINAWNRLNAAFRTPPGAYDKAYGLDKAGLN